MGRSDVYRNDHVGERLRRVRTRRRRSLERKIRAFGITLLAAALVTALILGLFLLINRGSSGKKVPDFVGMTYGEALRKASSLEIDLEISTDLDIGSARSLNRLKVTQQDPKASTELGEETSITVWLKGLKLASGKNERTGKDEGESGESESGQATPENTGEATPGTTQQGLSVCLDPGHSGNCPASEIDPETGLDVADNWGAAGEIQAVWELAQATKAALEQMGYRVVLTKDSPYSYVNLKRRAEIGNTCSIFVRLHYDPNLHAVLYPGAGQYKERSGRRHYVDAQVAHASAELANALFPFLKNVGITRMMNDVGGTSNNTGPAFVGSVFSRVPVVLIENDPQMIRDNPSGREQVARAIAQGVNAYFQSR